MTNKKKKLSVGGKITLISLSAVVVAVLLVGNLVLYWWVYPYIWYKRIAFAVDNNKCEAGHVVFVGDSITDSCDLDKYYPEFDAYNRGIAGDTTGGLLNRINISAVDLSPSVIVLLIGTNDYQRVVPHTNEHILKNYEKILTKFKQKLPDTKVIVQSVYPIANVNFKVHYKHGHGHIKALNADLEKLTESFGYTFANVYPLLEDGEEEMNMDYSQDGLHPNDLGYQVISGYLKPIIALELQK